MHVIAGVAVVVYVETLLLRKGRMAGRVQLGVLGERLMVNHSCVRRLMVLVRGGECGGREVLLGSGREVVTWMNRVYCCSQCRCSDSKRARFEEQVSTPVSGAAAASQPAVLAGGSAGSLGCFLSTVQPEHKAQAGGSASWRFGWASSDAGWFDPSLSSSFPQPVGWLASRPES